MCEGKVSEWSDWTQRAGDRVRKNEAAFKAHNERRMAFEQDVVARDEPIPFACECGDANCYEPVELTVAEFQSAHTGERRYLVRPGHVLPDYERVVARRGDHWIVEKYPAGQAPRERAAMGQVLKRVRRSLVRNHERTAKWAEQASPVRPEGRSPHDSAVQPRW